MWQNTAMVNELNAAKRLILIHFCLVRGIVMHVSSLTETFP